MRGVTQEGNVKQILFQTADVALPSISTGNIADAGHCILYSKKGGCIIDGETGAMDHFYRIQGVYFIKLRIEDDIVPPPPVPDKKPGFVRCG